jgi:hypothetical protein
VRWVLEDLGSAFAREGLLERAGGVWGVKDEHDTAVSGVLERGDSGHCNGGFGLSLK